jgi:hypothetical protein
LHQRYKNLKRKIELILLIKCLKELNFFIRISRGRNYDPISFEDFSDNGKWVLGDDPSFLTVDEIEEFHKQMAGPTIQLMKAIVILSYISYSLCIKT